MIFTEGVFYGCGVSHALTQPLSSVYLSSLLLNFIGGPYADLKWAQLLSVRLKWNLSQHWVKNRRNCNGEFVYIYTYNTFESMLVESFWSVCNNWTRDALIYSYTYTDLWRHVIPLLQRSRIIYLHRFQCTINVNIYELRWGEAGRINHFRLKLNLHLPSEDKRKAPFSW